MSALFGAGDGGKTPRPPNLAPVVNAGPDRSVPILTPLALAGTVTDDGLPDPPAAVTHHWSVVAAPVGGVATLSDDASLTSTVSFDVPGSYTLRLTASDARLTAHEDVWVVATPPAPVVAITAPTDGTSLPVRTSVEVTAVATSALGTITRVEYLLDGVSFGVSTVPATPPSTFTVSLWVSPPVGAYVLTCVATDSFGQQTTSDPVQFTATGYSGAPVAEITSPEEDVRVSAPTVISGVAAHAFFESWALQYRLKPVDGDPSPPAWANVAVGTELVGTPADGVVPAVPGLLGTFDPSLLVNGIYQLRLRVTDTTGTSLVDGPITLVVEGHRKPGAFSLSFTDLTIPFAGTPLALTRSYDSRDTRVGDFGPGWRLSASNVRVQKNRHLGLAWYQTLQSGTGIQFYVVDPQLERIVTVVFPDGETHRFRAGAYVKNRPGDPDNASFAVIVIEGKYRFYPLGNTTSKLEPVDATDELAETFYMTSTGECDVTSDEFGFEPFNPTRFRLTTKDGTVYILEERQGLLSMRDRNGNTLSVAPEAITVTHPTPSGPSSQSVTIHRTGAGIVDVITDTAGDVRQPDTRRHGVPLRGPAAAQPPHAGRRPPGCLRPAQRVRRPRAPGAAG